MNFNQYQAAAREFRLPTATPTYVALNLAAEAGEVAGKVAKVIRDGYLKEGTLKDAVKKELGDVLWHVAAMCDDLKLDMADVAWDNIDKLRDRKVRGVIQGSGDDR